MPKKGPLTIVDGEVVRPLKYYLAGPMTGKPKFNYDYFAMAANLLRCQGYTIVSPHEIDYNEDEFTRGQQPYHVYLKRGFQVLLSCDAIIMLPGWQQSNGAQRELQLALMCNMSTWYYNERMIYPYELP